MSVNGIKVEGWQHIAGGRGYLADYDGTTIEVAVSNDAIERFQELGMSDNDIVRAVEKETLNHVHKIDRSGENAGPRVVYLSID